MQAQALACVMTCSGSEWEMFQVNYITRVLQALRARVKGERATRRAARQKLMAAGAGDAHFPASALSALSAVAWTDLPVSGAR